MPPLPLPPPSTHPLALPPQPIFFVSLVHSTLVRRPPHARHFFASCQPTNQPAKSFSDVAPTDKWSALGLLACGHYWSMRFSVLLPSFSRHFFILLFSIPSFVLHLFPSSLRCPIFPSSLHAHIYILFYVTLLYYLSHFPRIPIRS